MRCALPEQRRCSRVHLPIRAIALFPDLGRDPHTALMRDMNMLGAFFYCMKKPGIGNKVKLNFSLPEQGEKTTIICEGVVVRVEESAEGAAIGVAIQFTRYQLAKPPKPQQPRSFVRERLSFIGYAVEMVERMFERTAGLRERMMDIENAA
ncbi:MAG TPA: PilZ domain-containing protein [Terriglobales bacterium]|nr:PilZ domain-containing protein [Terriglobales bacterium]